MTRTSISSPSCWKTLGEPAFVGGVELGADLLDAQPQRLALGGEAVDQLLLAVGQIVPHAAYSRDRAQHPRELLRGRLETRGVAALEAHRDIPAGRSGAAFGDGERLEPGRQHDALPPCADELGIAHRPRIGRDELHRQGTQVISLGRRPVVGARYRAEVGHRDVHQLLCELRLAFPQRPLEVGHEGFDPVRRSAGDEGGVGVQHRALGGGKEGEGDVSAGEQADCEQQHAERRADHREGFAHREGHYRPEHALAEVHERGV